MVINAHATSTKVGDESEARAILTVLNAQKNFEEVYFAYKAYNLGGGYGKQVEYRTLLRCSRCHRVDFQHIWPAQWGDTSYSESRESQCRIR